MPWESRRSSCLAIVGRLDGRAGTGAAGMSVVYVFSRNCEDHAN
jgi:hypothetical protein